MVNGKRAAAVGESDAQFRETLEDAAENHRANRERSFSRHPDEPRQPVFRHAFLADHVPGMNEDGSVELFRRAPDGLKRSIIEIQGVDPAGVRICVHVRADLRAAQSQFADATFQFLRRQIRILQRDRRQAGESLRMVAHDFGDVIVQSPGKIERVGRFRPITEHHRHGRKHLHGNFFAIHFFDAAVSDPRRCR